MFDVNEFVHFYIKDFELYEGVITANDGNTISLSYKGGKGPTQSSGVVSGIKLQDIKNGKDVVVNDVKARNETGVTQASPFPHSVYFGCPMLPSL